MKRDKSKHDHAFIQQRPEHNVCYVHVNLAPGLSAFLIGVFFVFYYIMFYDYFKTTCVIPQATSA